MRHARRTESGTGSGGLGASGDGATTELGAGQSPTPATRLTAYRRSSRCARRSRPGTGRRSARRSWPQRHLKDAPSRSSTRSASGPPPNDSSRSASRCTREDDELSVVGFGREHFGEERRRPPARPAAPARSRAPARASAAIPRVVDRRPPSTAVGPPIMVPGNRFRDGLLLPSSERERSPGRPHRGHPHRRSRPTGGGLRCRRPTPRPRQFHCHNRVRVANPQPRCASRRCPLRRRTPMAGHRPSRQ